MYSSCKQSITQRKHPGCVSFPLQPAQGNMDTLLDGPGQVEQVGLG